MMGHETVNHKISECCRLAQKETKEQSRLLRKVDSQAIAHMTEISTYSKMICIQTRIYPKK